MANPTAREQELLELIDRMRMNPAAELDILLNSTDADIQAALGKNQFNVDITKLRAEWSKLKVAAPLAWSSELNDAALAHNQVMSQYNEQSHHVGAVTDSAGNIISDKGYEPELAGRLTKAKYKFNGAAENIYAYVTSALFAHAGFAIDWGNDAAAIANGGIQNPAGHRIAMMNNEYREVGISMIDKDNNGNTNNVGPSLVTQEFSNRDALNGKAWLVGVAFQDNNTDGWYQAGEGLKDVSVKITGINGTNFSDTITVADAGGYQELLKPGQYQVDFIRGGQIVSTKTTSIDTKAPSNVKVDLVIPVVKLDPLASSGQTPAAASTFNPTSVPVNTPTSTLTQVAIALGSNQQTGESGKNIFDLTIDNKTLLTTNQTVAVKFANVSADAAYYNFGGLYRVEDAIGTVMDIDGKLYKADGSDIAGYIKAALRRSKETRDGTQLDRKDLIGDTTLHGGYIYAPFIIADGTVNDVLSGKQKNVYFNYKETNIDKADHFKLLGTNKLGAEDTFGGGDKDFNDLVFEVNAKVI